MSVVITSLTTVFVQASNSETDMNSRFQAQLTARLALDKMRREVHCARVRRPRDRRGDPRDARPPGLVPDRAAARRRTSAGARSAGTNRYGLYSDGRVSCDARASGGPTDPTQSSIFQVQTASTVSLAKLRVDFPIDVKTAEPRRSTLL